MAVIHKILIVLCIYFANFSVEKLVVELSNELTLITDPMQLSKLFRELFAPYLVDYMKRESDWLTERLTGHLEHYYQSQRHQKRALNVSGLVSKFFIHCYNLKVISSQ